VGLARQHATWELVESSGVFALHLFGADNIDWVWRFGLHSLREGDKLGGLKRTTAVTGCAILAGSVGWMDCRVEARLDVGDRTIYVAEVLEAMQTASLPPLTLKRALEGAPPENVRRLRQLYEQDGVADAERIRQWRQQQIESARPR
jgi:flavin reductase (DIM6/NTAB) family NADH-FMN oxidoreductase RutF